MNMHTLIAFIMAAAPALFLLYYFYKKDRSHPKSKKMVLKIFLIGIIYTVPVFGLEQIVSVIYERYQWPPLLAAFFEAFVVAALCEEYIKFRIIKTYVYSSGHLRKIFDGIMYTVTASLGFACMENIVFVINGTMETALNRGLTAVPMHAICSGMMGYYIGRARLTASVNRQKNLMNIGLGAAILIHGGYDFLLLISPGYGSIYSSLAIVFLAIVYLRLRNKIIQSLQD